MPTKPCCASRPRRASSSSSRSLSQASSLSDRTPQAIDAIAHGHASVTGLGTAGVVRPMSCDCISRRVGLAAEQERQQLYHAQHRTSRRSNFNAACASWCVMQHARCSAMLSCRFMLHILLHHVLVPDVRLSLSCKAFDLAVCCCSPFAGS